MGISDANWKRIRASQQRIAERRAARSLESGRDQGTGTGRDNADRQPDRDQVVPVGPLQDPNRFQNRFGDGNQIPVATPTRPQQVDHLKANGYTEPHYAKPGRLVGWIANRIGIRLRPKEKKNVEPNYEQRLDQAKKFNISTANMKGIIAAVAIVCTVIGGMTGKQYFVDEQSITVAVENIYHGYMGVLAAIGAITYALRIIKNVWSNRQRIKDHGVKISGPNADLSFDFAPKDGE